MENDPDHPTKEPFTSPEQSKTNGSNVLFKAVSVPFAALGGFVDQVSRKATQIISPEDQKPTPTTDNPTPTTTE